MRILEITSSLDGGGIARLLYDYCSRLIPEFEFDFVVSAEDEGILEEPLRNLGCNVFHVSQMKKNFVDYQRQMESIIKNGNYAIVHDHCDYKSYFELRIAKKYGIRTRIAHSHRAMVPLSFTETIIKKIFTPLTKYVSTNLFACGIDAAIWAWGNRDYKKGNIFLMKNAIHTEEFVFSDITRKKIREELGVANKFVIGNVGRFAYQKNHDFLIDIFSCIAEKRNDAVLLLIGRGELLDEVKKKVDKKGLSDKVIFLGVRNDVPMLLNAMDVFVLPSRFEGLGIVYVEAQANGLPCFATDKVVPEEVKVCDNFKFIGKEESADIWAQQILLANTERNKKAYEQVVEAGYDINYSATCLKRFYLSNE